MSRYSCRRSARSVYVGVDTVSGAELHWDLESSRNLNALAVGPSGSGKTVSLACLANRLARRFGFSILAIDMKGEYADLLGSFYNLRIRMVNPVVQRLNPCNTPEQLLTAVRAVFGERAAARYSYVLRIACEASEPLDKVASEYIGYEPLARFSECFSGESSVSIGSLFAAPTVLYLGSLLRICPRCVPAMYTFVLESAISLDKPRELILIVDEAWSVARYLSPRDLSAYLRLARSANVGVFMATQSLDDAPEPRVLIENSSLLLLFASDPAFAARLGSYVKVPQDVFEEVYRGLGVGECIAKIPGVGGYRICYVDPSPIR
ncbi:MAG: DUF87 domain-containing protein [Crenarchaeota archaeon]|nr:DUF87 domain-containing protein [Thermoproteota archaeon]